MNLFEIKNVAVRKKISIVSIGNQIKMTTQNLHRCIKDNRIEAGDLELIARALSVPVEVFFDEDVQLGQGQSGHVLSNVIAGNGIKMKGVNQTVGNENVAHLKLEIDYLKKALEEKERLIQLLLEKK